ncbi:hypothetical protein PHPALM_28407 [Phytophthora palmivora]|uniref:Secreted RxLR effector peptide protein n=1 Tax=Phytophthora palmivora TaxID=4796 RepID=A0A2P4XA65_9STRA|nr:hypothetical protein PHPALM_28407 [Phytophthora palmivora]
MRFGCFLLLLVFILAACCHSLINAENTALVEHSEMDSKREHVSAIIVKHYLKRFKKLTADEERAVPGVAKLTEFFEKIAKGEGATKPIKIAVDKVKPIFKKETRHASVSVAISLLKMLAFVGVISVASGYIVYRVSNR